MTSPDCPLWLYELRLIKSGMQDSVALTSDSYGPKSSNNAFAKCITKGLGPLSLAGRDGKSLPHAGRKLE